MSRRRSREITALNWPRSGSRPPTTLVPPPNGTTAMLRCRAQPQDLGDLVFVGRAAAPRRVRPGLRDPCVAAGQAWTFHRRAAAGRGRRRRSSRAPTIAASASRSAGDSADGRNLTWSGSSSVPPASSTPRACFSRVRIPSESGLAASGSPQVPLHGEKCIPLQSCVTVLHMLSISNDLPRTIGDRILEAAASCVVAYGVDRVTLAEIARRARVSRPTIYRRWPDTRALLAALLTARIVGVLRDVPSPGSGREALVERIVGRRRTAPARRRGHVGAALRARTGHGLHRRTPGHQPADPHRRGGRRAEGRPGVTAACGRAIRASSRRCAC